MRKKAVQRGRSRSDTGQGSIVHRNLPPPLPDECNLPLDSETTSEAPPVSNDDEDKTARSTPADAQFGVLSRSQVRRTRHVQSKSWLSSLALHALGLVLLFLILAPADFGGAGMSSLSITLEQSDQEQLGDFEVSVIEEMPDPNADSSPLPSASLNRMLLNGLGSPSKRSRSGMTGGARGSFFGIEAGGHEFVYVLDMSGSMQGRRFDRASAELIRSVEQLGQHQRFYVILFSSGTTQMFGGTEYIPNSVEATLDNKRRLATWLRSAYDGGGTDPREALRVAMRMNPSAIFMLSDGEFNGHKNQKDANLLGGNADAFSIVESAPIKTPIHAIAFEDKSSRDNMKRLSQITNGNFRFVASDEGRDHQTSMKMAREALSQGNYGSAELILRAAITNPTKTTGKDLIKAKVEFSDLLLVIAKGGIKTGNASTAVTALADNVQMDPKAKLTERNQNEMVGLLVDQLKSSQPENESTFFRAEILDFLNRHRKSEPANKLREPLASLYVTSAREAHDNDEFRSAVRELENAIKAYGTSTKASSCVDEINEIADELVAQNRKLQREQGDAAAAKHMGQLLAEFEDTRLRSRFRQELEDQVAELLLAFRDATMQGQRQKAKAIQQILADGIDDDSLVEKVKEDIALRERQAQAMYRSANRVERSRAAIAVRKYRDILQRYPRTSTARMARGRLQMLGWQGN